MTPELWARLKPLFDAALEKPPGERNAFIMEACSDDLELRSELAALVEARAQQDATTDKVVVNIQNLIGRVQPKFSPADIVLGRFKIVRQLGSGGMGDVYEAVDLELAQTVALKSIRPGIAGDDKVVSRFKKEVQLARRLGGPNLCRIHELFVIPGDGVKPAGAFLTMEFLDGVTLADKVRQLGPIPWRDAQAIAADICVGLSTMHEAGIIHRDLKCRNIMLTERNGSQRAVLMDFGLARELAPQTATADTGLTAPGVILGTPKYMAPEQFEGKEASPATDIYAMGVVLYELVTGKHPFASSTSLGTAILRARRLEPASSIQNGVPHQWDLVIAKCLEYDPKRRFQSANELAEALKGSKSCVFKFGDVEVRESEFRLCKTGKVLPVEPKAFRVLLFLLSNPGKLIGKKELLNAVWGDTIITEKSLARSIALLRRLLSDDARDPRYIETVSTVGYRFVCSVEMLGETSLKPDAEVQSNAVSQNDSAPGPSADGASSKVTASGKAGFRKRAILGTATVIALLAFAIRYLRLPLPPPRISEYFQITRDGERKFPVGTDGVRIYLNLLYPQGIGQVSISGGRITQIPIDLPNVERPPVWVRDVSPDGSSLLVFTPPEALFVAGSLGQPVRFLANGKYARWSPDGKFVAYATVHGEIYLIPSEGGEPHLLVPSTAPAEEYQTITDLNWSPDGGTIGFTRDQALWQVMSTGSNLHQLLTKWNLSSWKCCGVWTPDGEFYLFVSGELNSSPWFPGAQLWAIDERGATSRSLSATPVQLTSGPTRWGGPIPAHGGRKIFARGVTLRGELVRYDRGVNELRPYLGGISAEFVSFSPDGRSVAYVSFPDGALWRANRDGTGVVQLTQPPFYPKFPRWSPDGTQILFTDLGSRGQDTLYVISAQGGTPRRILPEDDGPQSDGNWSPDGKKMLYQPSSFSRSGFGSQGKAEFRILDLTSRRITTLPGSQGMYWPRWSPDGRSIAGVTRETHYLKVFNLDSQVWTPLENIVIDEPIWAHDSRYIYFMQWTDHPGVFRVTVAGGKAERIVDLQGFHHTGWFQDWMGLDPSDTPMLLQDRGSDDIYALALGRK